MMKVASSKEEGGGCCSSWGFRHIVMFLSFLSAVIGYALRVNMSVAIVAMVNNSHVMMKTAELTNSSCSRREPTDFHNQSLLSLGESRSQSNNSLSYFGEKFDWDVETQSFVLSAALYGSAVGQIPGGILTQRYGIRWITGITTMMASILCLLTPLAAAWSATAVIAIRFIQAVLQGSLIPVQSRSVSLWMPLAERSTGFAFAFNGFQVGVIAGMFVSGLLVESEIFGGWPSVFYVFGAAGFLWSILWMILVTDDPEQNPYISSRELEIIQSGQENKQSKNAPVPWKSILTSVPVWSQTLGVVGYCIGYLLLMTELPTYLSNTLDFKLSESGALSAAPYVVHCIVIFLCGYYTDVLRKKGKMSITTIRKMMAAIGLIGSALFMASIAFAGCDKTLVVSLLCISSGIGGFISSGCQVVAVDMSPNFTASISGFATMFGLLCGALVPYFVALLTKSGQTLENWSMVFIVHAAVIAATGLQFVIFGSGERQSWDYPKPMAAEGVSSKAMEDENKRNQITRF